CGCRWCARADDGDVGELAGGEEFVHPARHFDARGPVAGLGEHAGDVGGFEVEFDRVRAGAGGDGDEAGGRVDVSGGADRGEQVTRFECVVDGVQLQGEFSEPDDVGSHGRAAVVAGVVDGAVAALVDNTVAQ